MDKLSWKNVRVKLGDLVPWSDNPKFSTKAQAERILQSFEKFGQVQTVAVGPELEVYDGHQRLSALLTLHGNDYELDARQSSRRLTLEERKELVVTLHTSAVGSYNWEMIANSWATPDQLKNWGMDEAALAGWNRDAINLREMLNSSRGEDGDDIDFAAEWAGMPEFEQEDQSGIKSIIVHFMTQGDIEAFEELVQQKITDKTKSIWYPKKERLNLKEYVADEP